MMKVMEIKGLNTLSGEVGEILQESSQVST